MDVINQLLERMNAIESTFNEWCTKRRDLKNKIDNLKMMDDEKVKKIEKN